MNQRVKNFVISALRKAVMRWAPRSKVLNAAKTDQPYTIEKPNDRSRIAYICAACKGVFRSKEINVDHIIPVVDPKVGFSTFDDYVERLFVEEEGWQILCIECHNVKTKEETDIRTETRRNK